jgi:hypothetical protein
MVREERVIGAGVVVRCEGSGMGALSGDSFEALKEALDDIWAMGWVRGGAERIVSCLCWQ